MSGEAVAKEESQQVLKRLKGKLENQVRRIIFTF
jgi:hypothetical protein